MDVLIRQADASDTETVLSILDEAASWLNNSGKPMWRAEELNPNRLRDDVQSRLFYLAEHAGEAAGVMRFQLEDPEFWPDVLPGTSSFVHRLAVRRQYAGGSVSSALLNWAVERTRELCRSHLRLDCEASRPRLRAVYERFGFRHHSDRQVGPFFVARYEYPMSCTNN